MVDVYHIGVVRGQSAEAPIPIVDIQYTKTFSGGASNVLDNLRTLGGEGYQLAKLGKTQPLKNRLIANGIQIARWDEHDICKPVDLGFLEKALETADAVIISDYAKGAITDEVVDAFAGYVRPVFIDTKHDPDMFMPISDVTFFPNLVEYKKYLASYTRLGGKLILKRSADGLEYYEHNRLVASVPAYAKFVKSVNGAGDTVIAAYAYAKVAPRL